MHKLKYAKLMTPLQKVYRFSQNRVFDAYRHRMELLHITRRVLFIMKQRYITKWFYTRKTKMNLNLTRGKRVCSRVNYQFFKGFFRGCTSDFCTFAANSKLMGNCGRLTFSSLNSKRKSMKCMKKVCSTSPCS